VRWDDMYSDRDKYRDVQVEGTVAWSRFAAAGLTLPTPGPEGVEVDQDGGSPEGEDQEVVGNKHGTREEMCASLRELLYWLDGWSPEAKGMARLLDLLTEAAHLESVSLALSDIHGNDPTGVSAETVECICNMRDHSGADSLPHEYWKDRPDPEMGEGTLDQLTNSLEAMCIVCALEHRHNDSE